MTHDKTQYQPTNQSSQQPIIVTSTHYCHHTIHSTSPPLYTTAKTSIPTTPKQPSITMSKLKTKPSKPTLSPSEHLPFTFYFMHNCSNYISKLNLAMNLARLCTEIKRNIISYHNSEGMKTKNKTKNKKFFPLKTQIYSKGTKTYFTNPQFSSN